MTGILWLDILLAIVIGLVIWVFAVTIIRMLSTPPPEVDPDDVVIVDLDYRCALCGAEVTMTSVNPAEAKPPKHCREEMELVWRPH